jgi:hypothetical protein
MSENDTSTKTASDTNAAPQRTWTSVGARYTTPKRRPDVLRAISTLKWRDVGDSASVEIPAVPGLTIDACIQQLRLPRVSQLAWQGSEATVDWHDEDPEGQHYAIYGIQAQYANGRARLYVIDIGTGAFPLVSDFWPAAVETAEEASV